MLREEQIGSDKHVSLKDILETHEKVYAEVSASWRDPNGVKKLYAKSERGKATNARSRAKKNGQKTARKTIKSTENIKDLPQVIASLPHVKNRIELAQISGFALTFETFLDKVASSYDGACMLAGIATDGSVQHSEGRVRFKLQMRDVHTVSHTMRYIKEFSQDALEAVGSSAIDTAIKIRMQMVFESRDRKNSHSPTIGTFALDDTRWLDYAASAGSAGIALRKAIYRLHEQLHGHGVTARRTLSLEDAPNPAVGDVRRLVVNSALPRSMKQMLLSILDGGDPSDPFQPLKMEAILNGSVFQQGSSSQAFPWHHCYAEMRLGSSHTKSDVNLNALNTLFEKVKENGLSRKKFARHLIAAWAGFDGSMETDEFLLIIDDSPKMIEMFDVLIKLAFGHDFKLNSHSRKGTSKGKPIRYQRTRDSHRLRHIYTKLAPVMSDWIPRRKQQVCRQAAGLNA